MARLIIATLLAVAFVAAEGRVVQSVLAPLNALNASSVVVDGRKFTGQDLNARTCDHAMYKTVCYGLMKMSGVTTPRSFLEAALRVSLGKARMAKARFTEATKSSYEGNPMASILQSCDDNYDDLVTALEEAQRLLEVHGSNANLVSKMTAAGTYANDCDNWFGERKISSPYETMQRDVARVVSIALAIAADNKQI